QRIRLGTALAMAGEMAEAEAILAGPTGSSQAEAGTLAPRDRIRVDERRAWLKARGRQLEQARTLLERAVADTEHAASPQDLALPRTRLARLLVSSGQFDAAIAQAEPHAREGVTGAAAALAAETLALAHVYRGTPEAARA